MPVAFDSPDKKEDRMTLRDIVKKAALLIGANLDFSVEGYDQTLFILAGKDLLMRISGELCDVRAKEKAYAVGGVIPYTALSKSVKRIISVKKEGRATPFFETSAGIEVSEDGQYEVLYAYLIENADFLTDVDLPPKFNLYVLATGTVSDYCYKKGLYAEGKMFDERFVKALKNATEDAKNLVVKTGTEYAI